MLFKPKFKWENQEERSVFEIVSEDGIMQSNEILYVVQQICILLDRQYHEDISKFAGYIHPKNIIISKTDRVQISEAIRPIIEREAYIPPEQSQTDKYTSEAIIYSLGVLMIFMATGHENKTNLESFIENRVLRNLIEQCIAFDPQSRFRDIKELMNAIKSTKLSPKKLLFAVLILVCVCLIAGTVFYFYQQGKLRGSSIGENSGYATGYAIGYEKGFSDAPGIGIKNPVFDSKSGNLSGNYTSELGAIATNSEDEVFYIFEDNIYRMNPYTAEIVLMQSNVGAHNLNYFAGWLYYCTDEKIFRINPDNLKKEEFCDSHSGTLYIINELFYLYDNFETGYLYEIDPETKTLTQLSGSMEYLCLNIIDQKLFYIDSNKGNHIYSSDLDGGNLNLINGNYCESFCINNDKIIASTYNVRNDSNNHSISSLVSMDLDGGNLDNLTNISAHYPNVTDEGIFYVAGNNKTLDWISLDGRTHYTIVSSRTGPFNIAGRWIFYINEEDGDNLWRVQINGSENTRLTP
ncbi:MAG: DUF5050 domain-containing protein [Clostridiaceae bacterium]|nr:DUF5050 domain-containing protein [Clostridiaceae bacterium]